MKWLPDECKRGDIVRVKDGALYHYGIFVDENEIIAFGRMPSYYKGGGKGEKIVVLKTTAEEFSCGLFVEKGIPEKDEKKKLRKADEIVAAARSRLGEDGYNIIHNNCEHFVNECAFGVKRSAQEEEIRCKWNARPRVDVYICLDKSAPQAEFVPTIRRKSIERVKNGKLFEEKRLTWNVLTYAAAASFRVDLKDVKFGLKRNGKWVADKFYFSLSHSGEAAVAVVSDATCGVDIENIAKFSKKCEDESFCKAFAKKINCETADCLSAMKSWTGKESVYKAYGKGRFAPGKIPLDEYDINYLKIGDYLLSVVGEGERSVNYFLIENGKSRRVLKGDYECV